MQTFKVFVSSPSDVMVERRRVENVVSRLNGEFAGVARLHAIRWETEFYQAFSTFQAQIPRSTDCDLVIGILRWRLGTELPSDFGEKLPDHQPFPSGTAYEILTAVEKRQKGGELPDVYVFRFAGSSPSVAIDDPDRARVEHDWQLLKSFFQQWFLTEHGHFKAAFNPYTSEDDFEAQLEKLLRKWVADKVAGGRVVRWPIEVKGSPFRGLAAFGAKHAPVFFGRGDDTTRAVDLWQKAGRSGSPYLLVVGASGSGKSSLARAGLVPRLTTPGVVTEVDGWRIAVMRPGDSPAGSFTSLAAALMQDEAALPKEEEGRGPALPEIAQGDSRTPAEFAAVLQHADAAAIKPIINALSRVGTGERGSERYGRDVRCDLVLLIDQFEELFAASVSEAERTGFIDLVAALVSTGRIWVAATLRADFYARMLDQPVLKKLKALGATYDLAPPGPIELAEIVREPAEAAGLVFETDAATGERLDARLLRDADRPDMLPLVQLALSRLYEGRESVAGAIRLPLKVYEGLGGLKGIVNEAGETALASLGEAEKARLPRLLRQLAVPAHDQDGIGKGALTIRPVPLAQAAPDETGRRLLDALVTARLLTATGIEADAQVRLTHQRVLEDWSRARGIVAESADFYRIRADLEESRRKWVLGNRRGELLLARGLPLAEATSIVGKYSDELAPEVLDYVRASRTRANRAQIIGWSAAAVFFLLAIGAGIAAKVAFEQRAAAEAARARAEQETQRADRNFTAAKETVDGLIINIAQGLSGVAGMRVDTIRQILETVQKTIDQLIQTAPNDPRLLRSRAVMFGNFVDTYLTADDLQDAAAAAAQSLDIFRKLAAGQPGNAQARRDVSVSLGRLGDVKLRAGDQAAALAAYQESLNIDRTLAAQDPGNAHAQRDVAVSLDNVGDGKLQQGDLTGALAAYQESRDIRRKLAAYEPGDAHAQRDESVSLVKIGDVKLQEGDLTGSLAAYQESLEIRRKLAAQDPGNAQAQRDVSVALERLGDVKLQARDRDGALAAYQESLDIRRRLAAQDPGNAQARRDVSVSLDNVGDAKLQKGDQTRSLAAYQEGLDIRRRLAAQDPGNAQAQRDMTVSLIKFGDVKLRTGDQAGALAAYRESLDIRRKLAAHDPGDAQAQTDLVVCLLRLSLVVDPAQARTALTEASLILEKLDHEQKLTPAQKHWLDIVHAALSKLP
jgi:eukaryotic-like serine/threonine-protein kinase